MIHWNARASAFIAALTAQGHDEATAVEVMLASLSLKSKPATHGTIETFAAHASRHERLATEGYRQRMIRLGERLKVA